MFKRLLGWFFSIAAIFFVALAVFLINLIYFRPWSLNLFYEKVFAQAIFSEPELLSSLGLVEQFGITGHNGKLNDESPAHQEEVAARWRKDLKQLRAYPSPGRRNRNGYRRVSSTGFSRDRSRASVSSFTITP